MRTGFICVTLAFLLMCASASAQWAQVQAPYGGGYVLCLAGSGTNLFAATRDSGVFLSTNNGATWTLTSLRNQEVLALAFSGQDIFAGTGGDGVFHSDNNGTSWTAANTGLPGKYIMSLFVSDTILFAGTASGVFLSTNRGATWIPRGLHNANILGFAMSDTNLFALCGGRGVYRSTNNGASWGETGLTNVFVSTLAFSGNHLFAGSENGVFFSTNNGESWTEVNNGLPKNPGDTTHYQVSSLEVIGTNILVLTTGGVYRSTNNGASWSPANSGLISTWVTALAVSGANLFAGAYNGGVFLSTDAGSSWRSANDGLVRTDMRSVAVSGTNLYVGTSVGVFLSTNVGSVWSQVSNGLENPGVDALTISGTYLFAGTSTGVFLSTNNGASWSAINNVTGPNRPGSLVSVSSHGAGGTNLFLATGAGVFLSTDNGTSWTKRDNGLENTVTSLAVSGTTVYAAASAEYGGVYRTTDNGTTWGDIAPSDLRYPNSIVALGQMVLVGSYYNGVYRSTDNGGTWQSCNNGFWSTGVLTLAASGTNLFAAIGGYVWRSIDSGATWTAVNSGFATKWYGVAGITAFAISDSMLYAFCQGKVWKRPLLEMVKVPPHPFISSVADVAGDDGGEVSISWLASDLDRNSATITYYSIWRSISPTTSPAALGRTGGSVKRQVNGPASRMRMYNGQDHTWEWIANLAANQAASYSTTVPTVSDSMSTTTGMNYFFVLAHTNDPRVFYYSNIDSGYSVDNLAPQAPRNLDYRVYGDAVFLRWNPNTESDFSRYAIYRSAHPISNLGLLQPYTYSRDWVFVDSAAVQRGYYRICAQDVHENWSPPSNQVRVLGAGPRQPQWVETSLDSVGARCFTQKDASLFAGTGRGIFRSTDDGTSWTVANAGLTDTVVNVLGASGTSLFAATNTGVFVSDNNGGNWTQTGLLGATVTSMVVSGMNLYAGSTIGVVRSTDGGTDWNHIDSGLTCRVVNSLAIDSDGSGRKGLVAGTGAYYWKFGSRGGVFMLPEGVQIWTSLGLSGKAVNAVAAIAQGTGGTYFLASLLTGGVYRNARTDTIWTSADSGLANWRVTCFAASGDKVFAGTDHGVFLSTNNGTVWTHVSTGLSDTSIASLAVWGTNLFAGTDAGVWKRPLSEMVVAVPTASQKIPQSFALDQNYPNPFNPSTTIRYEVPKSSMVRLSVYDILGREVAVLVNERKNAGVHEVKFDGSSLASGVYFYRIQAGDFVQSKKLVVAK